MKFVWGAFLVLAAIAAMIIPAGAGGRPLDASLSGANEVGPEGQLGVGDPDATGDAHVTLNQGQGEVCFDVSTSGVDGVIVAAHIHIGAAGTNGGVVVSLDWPNTQGSGCVDADADTIKAIRQNPAGYYINVHSTAFPPGAVRGQLSK